MPTYQYRCTQCGEDLEAVQRFSDAPLTICPSCGGQLRKIFNAVGVVFKGSGFYRTDSRNGSKRDDRAESDAKPAGKEPVSTGSATSGSSGNGKQPASSGASSTGEKAARS